MCDIKRSSFYENSAFFEYFKVMNITTIIILYYEFAEQKTLN